jgi:hypothetical protein
MALKDFKFLRGCDYELNLNMRTVEVRAGQRTIRAHWNPEMAQDLEALYGIDVESELSRFLSEQIGREMNQRIIEDIGLNVQRIFARTIAQDLVPVQPLPGPTGILHHLDYSYDGYMFKNFKLLRG